MTTLAKLTSHLNELLISSPISDYCLNGLQIEGQENISCIATAVTADLETIQAAIKCNAQALLVHHGLFWQGDSFLISGPKREKIRLLLKHEISLLAYHLPLDIHRLYGNNWRAAQELGWTDLQPFGLYNSVSIGVKGKIKPASRKEFQKQLEDYYQHSAQTVFGGKDRVETVALVSGAAYKLIPEAISNGIDCFVTGTADEPVWHLAREGKINFMALGHAATERIGPRAIGEHLKDVFQIEQHFIDTTNPF